MSTCGGGGGGGGGGGAGDVLQRVSQLWSMMDELCENDPQAYRSFVDEQMRAGAEYGAPPELRCSVRTPVLEPEEGLLYINICSWKRVPPPQDASQPIPVCAGRLEAHTDEGRYSVLDVAFNPAVLQAGRGDRGEMEQLYMLALSFAQQQHGLRLSQRYAVVERSPKSGRQDLYRRLGFRKPPDTPREAEPVSQTPADLLRRLSAQHSEEPGPGPEAQISRAPAGRQKKGLIQVISATYEAPSRPRHRLEVKTDASGAPRAVELTVELPKVCSVSECRLSVSERDVLLEVEDVYRLLVEFPHAVNEDTAAATFDRRNRRLALSVDVL